MLEFKQIKDFEEGIQAFKLNHLATYVVGNYRYRVAQSSSGRWQVNRVVNSDGTGLLRATPENNPGQVSAPAENQVANLTYS